VDAALADCHAAGLDAMVYEALRSPELQAAYYARCAAQYGRYWPYESLLFPNREQLDENHLQRLGRRATQADGQNGHDKK